MDVPNVNRKYSPEEKHHLIANLDIEVTHRLRQFESWLQDRLENFSMHQEGQVLRIPKQVRNMTMREFGETYNGNIQAALRGFQKEKLVAEGGIGTLGELDKDARKRKWVESQESLGDERDPDKKAPKNARLAALSSPKKVASSSTRPGTARYAKKSLANGMRTPNAPRILSRMPPSPSPQKSRPPFGSNVGMLHNSRQPSRPASPAKAPGIRQPVSRVPSSSTFNPDLPSKPPRFPTGTPAPTSLVPPTLRLPRRDESMLSVNGSPLANPYQFDPGWLGGGVVGGGDISTDVDQAPNQALKRATSSILIRRDPSAPASAVHSRTNSQASIVHTDPPQSQPQSCSSSSRSQPPSHSQPTPTSQSQSTTDSSNLEPTTPRRRTHTSALVAIPTKDGHLLEFDPLRTSPGALDALEGISDSAKKQARLEMGKLMQAAVDKWKLG